jgi:hypothetical protein
MISAVAGPLVTTEWLADRCGDEGFRAGRTRARHNAAGHRPRRPRPTGEHAAAASGASPDAVHVSGKGFRRDGERWMRPEERRPRIEAGVAPDSLIRCDGSRTEWELDASTPKERR